MGYQSDKVTDLLEKARSARRKGERAKLYHEAETQIAADAPMAVPDLPATLQASPSRSTGCNTRTARSGCNSRSFSREPKRCRISSLSLPLVGRVAGRRPVGWG